MIIINNHSIIKSKILSPLIPLIETFLPGDGIEPSLLDFQSNALPFELSRRSLWQGQDSNLHPRVMSPMTFHLVHPATLIYQPHMGFEPILTP